MIYSFSVIITVKNSFTYYKPQFLHKFPFGLPCRNKNNLFNYCLQIMNMFLTWHFSRCVFIFMYYLVQRFPPWGSFGSIWRHFDCHSWVHVAGISWLEVPPNILLCTGQALATQSYPAQHVSSTKDEKPWFSVREAVVFSGQTIWYNYWWD